MSDRDPFALTKDDVKSPRTLPRREHHGVMLPVPWVTLWAPEEEAKPKFRPYHSRWGVVTLRVEPDMQGEGEPMWARVHTGRSFRSVRRGLCQVCGQPGDLWRTTENAEPSHAIGWEGVRSELKAGDSLVVTEPATCGRCVKVAERLCPNVRDEGPWSWWHVERGPICGGMFGPAEGREARPVLLIEGERPPRGWVMKQPFLAVTLQRPFRPEAP